MIYFASQYADHMTNGIIENDKAKYEYWDDKLGFFTPILKGFLTELGLEAANIGMQVFGGHGFVREWGVEPQRAFALAGVEPGLFDDADSRLPFETLSRLLDICSELSGCAHFGLAVGERFELRAFGALGELMRNVALLNNCA